MHYMYFQSRILADWFQSCDTVSYPCDDLKVWLETNYHFQFLCTLLTYIIILFHSACCLLVKRCFSWASGAFSLDWAPGRLLICERNIKTSHSFTESSSVDITNPGLYPIRRLIGIKIPIINLRRSSDRFSVYNGDSYTRKAVSN